MTATQPEQYETYETMILSDQIPAQELHRLLPDNPDLARWYTERAAERRRAASER